MIAAHQGTCRECGRGDNNFEPPETNELLSEKVKAIFQTYLTEQARDSMAKCNGKCRCVLDKVVIDKVLAAINNTRTPAIKNEVK